MTNEDKKAALDQRYAASRLRSAALDLHGRQPTELERLESLRREAYAAGRGADVARLDQTIDIVDRSSRR
jgi:hypothetical protein